MINYIYEHFLPPCATAQVAKPQGEFVYNKLAGTCLHGFRATSDFKILDPETSHRSILCQWVRIAPPEALPMTEEELNAGIYQHFNRSVAEQYIELESRHNGTLLPYTGIVALRRPLCKECPASFGSNFKCSREMQTTFAVDDKHGILDLYHLPIPLQPSLPRHKLKR